ncbi:hypothetical protein QE152_g14017 [Popillia japonica]|uniref:Uncharacterized protein n=1 Tax=Popillia japonica TaxID=7064 RepID=A0AAW1LAU6_POPJA
MHDFYTKVEQINDPYRIDSELRLRERVVRDLAVEFDSSLSFIPHVETTVRSASKMLGFAIRNGNEFDSETLKRLYYAFVRPRLEYCAIIWHPIPIYSAHSAAIGNVQRRFMKYLAYRSDGVHPPREVDNADLLDRFQMTLQRYFGIVEI